MKYSLERLKKMMDDTGGSLYLSGTQITSLPENLTVGGNLYLRGTQITSLPENLTVGGWLDLSGTQITSLPENLTVGGSLDLSGTQITSLPENLTVGGNLYLSGTQISNRYSYNKLQNGDYVSGRYLYADGILTHIKRRKNFGKYLYYVGKIKGRDVISDGVNYAHCKNLKDGIADLEFKKAKDRGADQYRSLTPDSVISKDDAITMYRVITGACKAGTEQFLSGINEFKDTYTVREIIDITKGQYGHETIVKFFE